MRNPNNADKIEVKRRLPKPNEGDNGSLSLNLSEYGIGLYGKVNSRWYRFGNGQNLSTTDLQVPNGNYTISNCRFIKSDLDLTFLSGNGTVVIDKDSNRTTNSTTKAFYVDFDHTGIAASGQTLTNIGLDLDINCESVTHVGTVNQTGIDIDMVAATAGTQTNTGLDISCTGADTNTHIKLSHDSTNYCTFTTIADGVTTIGTTDSDGTVAHLTLKPDGDLVLDPVSQKTIINATDGLYFDGGDHTYIAQGAVDRLDFTVGGTLLLQIYEGITDAIHVNCHLDIDAASKLFFDGSAAGHTYIQESSDDVLDFYVGTDKMLALDEANDKITMAATNWVAGTVSGGTVTEFSAASSAYAGMILGYTDIGLDETTATYNLTTSYAVPTSEFFVRFKIPPSGNVEIEIQIMIDVGASNVGDLYAGLSDNATYNAVDDFHEVELFDAMSRGAIRTIKHSWTLTGLSSVGDTEDIYVGFKTSNILGTPHLQWGGDAANKFPDFIIKAIALPAAIAT
jgi:hypothetical protein